jgi:hypothetical protein
VRTHLLLRVTGVVAIETGNQEVVAPRYGYEAFEAFALPAVTAADALAGRGGDDRFPYELERRTALEHAERDVAAIGPCARLVDAQVEKMGWQRRERFSAVTTSTGVELTAEELAGLCTGGRLP